MAHKRFFLVESNSDYESLFCYEVEQAGHHAEGGRLFCQPGTSSLFHGVDREQFFGNLNSLCPLKPKVDAPPMKLAPPDLSPKRPIEGEVVATVEVEES